jgi:hypothetical protein
MSKARLVITAVTVEKRPVSEVAKSYGVARSWVYALLARYEAEGEAAYEPRSRRPKTSPTAISPDTAELITRLEDPPVGGRAEPLDVGAEQPDQDRGDGNGAALVAGAVLQAAFLAGGALVGPGPPGPGRRGGQDDPSPPGPRQVQVGLAEHDPSDGRSAA